MDQKFEQGFKLNEWRWKTKKRNSLFFQSSKPLWNGEKKKSVFVWGEQGIGDQIMFASIIPELHAICSKLIVQCDKRLIPLFRRSFHKDIIYHNDQSVIAEDSYDFHTPIGSLPCIFRTSLESFKKTSNGYLRHEEAKTKKLRQTILAGEEKTLIGISWRTNSQTRDASIRNIELADLAQNLDSANTQLVCLQYGDVDDQINQVKTDFGIKITQISEIDNFSDIDGLASLIMACDQIVSMTNATIHLAGALGANVKVLLPITARQTWGKYVSDCWCAAVSQHTCRTTLEIGTMF